MRPRDQVSHKPRPPTPRARDTVGNTPSWNEERLEAGPAPPARADVHRRPFVTLAEPTRGEQGARPVSASVVRPLSRWPNQRAEERAERCPRVTLVRPLS